MATSRIRQKVDFCHGLGCAQNGWDDWRSGLAMDLIRQTRYPPPLLLPSSTEPTVDAGGRGGGFGFSESGHYMPGHVTDPSTTSPLHQPWPDLRPPHEPRWRTRIHFRQGHNRKQMRHYFFQSIGQDCHVTKPRCEVGWECSVYSGRKEFS